MYPAHGIALFPPFPRDNRVFVAMSFAKPFERRWKEVIEPGAQDAGVQAFRANIPKASSSIPADIVLGIARSRLVLADITSVDGQRNGNVMYEVGIAHASRLPEEVILFRSDNTSLLFDVATVRVNEYDPDNNTSESRSIVAEALRWALSEVDTVRSLTVQRTAEALDVSEVALLFQCRPDGMEPPGLRVAGEFLVASVRSAALRRLLQLELVQTEYRELRPGTVDSREQWEDVVRRLSQYRVTEFGVAVLRYLENRLGGPERMRSALRQ